MKKNKCPDCPTEIGKRIGNTENSLLKNPGTEELEIYKLYVERIMKHYDLRLVHFKIYLGFNSGLILIVGYLLKLYLDRSNGLGANLLPVLLVLPVVGMLFSLAWFLVGRKDRQTQLDMNKILGEVEKKILINNEDSGLYTEINKSYPPEKKCGFDIIDINVYMAFFFISIWIAFRFFACYFIS